MIFVTGDVHQHDMGGPDQAWLARHGGGSEVALAERFVECAEAAGVPVTLFLAGRCAATQGERVAALSQSRQLEIGGHTWKSLQPAWRHFASEALLGSHYGPRWFQERDIRRTTNALAAATGYRPRTWRTHSYRGDATTAAALDRQGYWVISDRVAPDAPVTRLGERLVSLPINTPPDHDQLSHGDLTGGDRDGQPSYRSPAARRLRRAAKRVLGIGDLQFPFGAARAERTAWLNWLLAETDRRVARQGFATLLLHPACMEIVDGMATLQTIFAELAGRDCRFVRAAPDLVAP